MKLDSWKMIVMFLPFVMVPIASAQEGLAGVDQGFQMAKRAFTAAERADGVVLLTAEGGHQFYPDLAWPVIQKTLASWNTTRTE